MISPCSLSTELLLTATSSSEEDLAAYGFISAEWDWLNTLVGAHVGDIPAALHAAWPSSQAQQLATYRASLNERRKHTWAFDAITYLLGGRVQQMRLETLLLHRA